VQLPTKTISAAMASALPPSRPEAVDLIGSSILKSSGEFAFRQFALSRAPVAQGIN
jgi:hypothetical protein